MALALEKDRLVFEFPEVHPAARMAVSFHRTLRVPDDGNTYPLPPGLGRFPLRTVAELDEAALPSSWRSHGGLVMPMWQAEACWLGFESRYPFLVKVGAGDVDALTGEPWSPEPDFGREDYLEVPAQPWLDGYVVAHGRVRQFVAMPLGSGYSLEEQLRSGPARGGIRVAARPCGRSDGRSAPDSTPGARCPPSRRPRRWDSVPADPSTRASPPRSSRTTRGISTTAPWSRCTW